MLKRSILTFVTFSSVASNVTGAPIYYADRIAFLTRVGTSITDDYSGYTITPGTPLSLTDAEMSAVFVETEYESISFSDLNLVGDVYIHGDGTNYCAGCNGNFKLRFDNTSLSTGGGVFGIGIDIVLHTSRRSSIGDIIPGDRVEPGTVVVEFTDGVTESFAIPPDIGFFGPGGPCS
jgi:hypothetical protein